MSACLASVGGVGIYPFPGVPPTFLLFACLLHAYRCLPSVGIYPFPGVPPPFLLFACLLHAYRCLPSVGIYPFPGVPPPFLLFSRLTYFLLIDACLPGFSGGVGIYPFPGVPPPFLLFCRLPSYRCLPAWLQWGVSGYIPFQGFLLPSSFITDLLHSGYITSQGFLLPSSFYRCLPPWLPGGRCRDVSLPFLLVCRLTSC
jgi:hypothetical protein